MDDSAPIAQALRIAAEARRCFPRARSNHSASIDATTLQVLLLISLRPSATTHEMAEQLHLHQSTVALAVARLEGLDYIRQVPDPADRRRRLRKLTRSGRAQVVEFERGLAAGTPLPSY